MNDPIYNFVIYSVDQDYFKVIFNDILDQPNVEYISHPIKKYYNSFIFKLYQLHNIKFFDKKFKLPFTSLWQRFYFKNPFTDNRPLCFIFFMNWATVENERFFRFLKRKYPNCKFVLYCEDIISSRKGRLDFQIIKTYFDLCISYDPDDAKTYNFKYYPTFYSKISLPPKDSTLQTDACFIGAAKNRYDLIIKIFNKITSNGVSAYFGIGRPPKHITMQPGIDYIPYVIPYSTYLNKINNTNCIVEILQEDCSGYTLRTWEALFFNKKLLTNNPMILEAPFYNKKQFCYFKSLDDIDINFIKNIETIDDSPYIETLSPKRFLDFIVSSL